MEKDRGFRVMAIIAILLSIVGVTVGFSSLNETLRINTSATLKRTNWTVRFSNLETPALTGTAVGTASLDSGTTILTAHADLKKPGDKVVYTFDVVNTGDIDAVLSADPIFSGDTAEATAAKINYTLTYADGSPLLEGNSLANTTGVSHLVLTLEYDSSATAVVAEDTTFDLTVALLYTQS